MVVGISGRPSTETAWVDIGVDDLTKFRIIEFIYDHPDDEVEVDFLASSLGFHSVEKTESVLDELARDGLVRRIITPDQPQRCALTSDSLRRGHLEKLISTNRGMPSYGKIMSALSQRTIARARAKLRGRRANTLSEELDDD